VLAFKQRTHGPRSIATGTSLNSLGSLLRKQGAMEEAERLLREALAIREAHPQASLAVGWVCCRALNCQGSLGWAGPAPAIELPEVAALATAEYGRLAG